jgi:hypothetical protein
LLSLPFHTAASCCNHAPILLQQFNCCIEMQQLLGIEATLAPALGALKRRQHLLLCVLHLCEETVNCIGKDDR